MRGQIVAIIVMLLLSGTVSAGVLDDSLAYMSSAPGYTQEIPQRALLLRAGVASLGKVENESSVIELVENLTQFLLDSQNEDGGWGHFEGSTSTVPDTAYSLLALNAVQKNMKKYGLNVNRMAISRAIREGKMYLLKAYNGNGWGYIDDSPTEFYPTALAAWALGELGNEIPSSTVKFLASVSNPTPDQLALRLLAYHGIGITNSSDVEMAEELLNSDKVSPTGRAKLTYALSFYEPFSFTITRSLSIMESSGKKDGMFYLTDRQSPFLEYDSIIPTLYAILAFAQVTDEIKKNVENPRDKLCDVIFSTQNRDGGWPIEKGGISRAKSTYYALRAMLTCRPTSESITRAVNWARKHLKESMDEAKKEGTVTLDYYYTLKILLLTGSLSEEEKMNATALIISLENSKGLWNGMFTISQPFQTSLALDLLRGLGENGSEVLYIKEWLLSLTRDGWGIRTNDMLPIMVGKDVPTTLTVLTALENVSTEEELKPHVEWLLSQRLPNGLWGTYGKSVNMLGDVSYSTPSVEYTIRTVEFLARHGHSMGREILPFVLDEAKREHNVVEMSLMVNFLAGFNLVGEVSLSQVIEALYTANSITIITTENRAKDAEEIFEEFKGSVVEIKSKPEIGKEGMYVVMVPFESGINVTRYNSKVHLGINGSLIILNGKPRRKDNVVLIIPGRTEKGYILFILYDDAMEEVVKTLFRSGMIRYIHGNYLLLGWRDKNKNGKVEPEEITALN